MATTFTKIASVTVGAGGATSIVFSSIPSTYTDFKILLSARSTASAIYDSMYFYVNTNGSNGSWKNLWTDSNSMAYSNGNSGYIEGNYVPGATATSNTFGNAEIYFTNYAGSTAKSISVDGVTENNATTAYLNFRAILWNSTAAVTQFTGTLASGNFAQYSTATLYGISKS
jgi:hypothetical protein